MKEAGRRQRGGAECMAGLENERHPEGNMRRTEMDLEMHGWDTGEAM